MMAKIAKNAIAAIGQRAGNGRSFWAKNPADGPNETHFPGAGVAGRAPPQCRVFCQLPVLFAGLKHRLGVPGQMAAEVARVILQQLFAEALVIATPKKGSGQEQFP